MIREEIVTYEVAKLAKEKRFNVPTDRYYHIYDDVIEAQNSLEMTGDGCADFFNSLNQYRCAAPTQSLLQRWLREEKGVDIVVMPIRPKFYSFFICSTIPDEDGALMNREHSPTYELALEDALKYALKELV